MSNDFFDEGDFSELERLTTARAEQVNEIVAAIVAGFDKLPSERSLKENRVTHAVDASVSANVFVLTPTHVPADLQAGLFVTWVAAYAVTGASTINYGATGATALKRWDLSNLEANDITAGAFCVAGYDGTRYQLLWPIAGITSAAAASALAAAASALAAATSATSSSNSATAASSSATAASSSASAAAASAAAAAASAGSAKRLFLGALSGTGNAMVSAVSLATVSDGMLLEFVPFTTSTAATPTLSDGAITLNVQDRDGASLPSGALVAGRFYQGTYFATGTEVRLHSHTASQTVAEAGTDDVASMTSLRVKQSIDANIPADAFVRSATTPHTGATGDKVAMDCSSAAKTYTLPTSVTANVTRARVSKIGRNLLTIDPGSNKIQLPNGAITTGSVVVVGAFNGILDFRFVGTLADGTTLVWAL